MEPQRPRLCVGFLLTITMISFSVYVVVRQNLDNLRNIRNLREDIEELSYALSLSTSEQAKMNEENEKSIPELVQEIVDDRLSKVLKEIYDMKAQVKGICTTTTTNQNVKKREAAEPSSNALKEKRINYAAQALGAKIQSVEARGLGDNQLVKTLLQMEFIANPPVNVLNPSMQPGNCFAFKDNSSSLTIRLAEAIIVEGVELEHIASSMSPTGDISGAPRFFQVAGVWADSDEEMQLGSFEYTADPNKMRQYFPVKLVEEKFQFVRFLFLDNHGNPNYTCVYNIAVYGRER